MPLLPGQDVRSSPDFTGMRKGDVPFLNITPNVVLKKRNFVYNNMKVKGGDGNLTIKTGN